MNITMHLFIHVLPTYLVQSVQGKYLRSVCVCT